MSFYDNEGQVVVGQRDLESKKWHLSTTFLQGNVKDAHNAISMAIDGDGFIHMAWDHHNTPLNYVRGKEPFAIEFADKEQMVGSNEGKVTYPEFYTMPNGDVLFFYRSGESGRGNLIVNRYNLEDKEWVRVQDNLLDGENERSAYWQACVDDFGTIHLSWVWRETWDVSTNHDICYAKSTDGGVTWQDSHGRNYELPITAKSSEIAWKIPQNRSLINQTSMTTDKNGNPYIASYWADNDIPQFQVVYLKNDDWKRDSFNCRNTAFQLGGGGTKRIPISRPELLVSKEGGQLYLIFRDEERGNKISLASMGTGKPESLSIVDITEHSVGQWEPNYDTSLWNRESKLHIFSQYVEQEDNEGLANTKPSEIEIVEIKKLKPIK